MISLSRLKEMVEEEMENKIKELEEKLLRKEQECEKLRTDIKDIANLLDLDTGEEYNFGNIEIAIKGLKQECERLKKELHKNFEEKDTLHLIIDRLLEASGYDTNTASAEDFEDVYERMRYEQQQLNQLKAENDKYSLFIEKLCDYAGLECDSEEQAMRTLSDLASQMNKARWIIDRYKQTLTEIKEIAENRSNYPCGKCIKTEILQKISECEGNDE